MWLRWTPLPAGSGVRGYPVVRQEFGDAGDGMGRDTRQDVLQPGEGIDRDPLARCDEASEHRRRPATSVAAEKRPVVATDCDPPDRTLGGVVVNLEIAVLAVTGECGPILQGVPYSSTL